MTRVSLNKSALKQERDRLVLYRRVLPSLSLKRQQLAAESKRAREELAGIERQIEQELGSLEGLFRILGGNTMQLSGLVRVLGVQLGEENVVGTRLPVVVDVRFEQAGYSTLSTPFWVDFLVEALRRVAEWRVRRDVALERVARLEASTRRTTQRVNLFEKRLIPEAESNIRRIGLALSEQERSAVVRSKLAKRKE